MKVLKTILFYIIQFTWGLPMNVFGIICLIIAVIKKDEINKCDKYIYIINPNMKNCGFEAGIFFVLGTNSNSAAPHEMGHGVQNLIFGLFMPILVSIPSCIRFWIRKYIKKHNPQKYNSLPSYDSIWFEDMATKLGQKYYAKIWEQHLLHKNNR